MAKSELRPLIARGKVNLVNFNVVDEGESTYSIPLPRSDFLQGFVLLVVPNTVSSAIKRRNTVAIYCTTVAADAVSQATARGSTLSFYNYNYSPFVIVDYLHKGYAYDVDGFLSDRFYNSGATNVIRVNACRINGANLDITFHNSQSFLVQTTVDISWRVERPAVL